MYYYHQKRGKENREQKALEEDGLGEQVEEVFRQNRQVYGSRKIKAVLAHRGVTVSRRKVCRLMGRRGLVAQLGRRKPKPAKERSNQCPERNLLNRRFHDQEPGAVIVSDLTYVRVGGTWNYVCILLDLHNREIVGHSVGTRKTAELVYEAFAKAKVPLTGVQLFHTDRGKEFDNELLRELLAAFGIQHSLSAKACPYDNAVAEAAFKVIKAEFVNRRGFQNLEQLRLQLADYIHWYNHIRVHSALGYVAPVRYRLAIGDCASG